MKTKRVAVPIFYNYGMYSGLYVENLDDLNDYLDQGWSIESVDKLRSDDKEILIYILAYYYYDETATLMECNDEQ